jgi:mono/diheme cytochrome c family protein
MKLIMKCLVLCGTVAALAIVAGVLSLLCACNPNRQGCGTAASNISDANAPPGQVVFEKNCIRCHPYGRAGKGPNLSKKKLTPEIVRKQVRRGGLFMPSFSEEQINNEELEQLAEFVPTLGRK